MDKSLINGVLFLDLKKAFVTVDHKILIAKLEVMAYKGTHYIGLHLMSHKESKFVKLTTKYQILPTSPAESRKDQILGHYSS